MVSVFLFSSHRTAATQMEAVGKGFEQARKKHRGVGDELLRDVEEIITLVEPAAAP